ncbi:hypothetical protein GCM10027026_41620 [Myroides odoratimimus subsp. xuanwuensis]
MSAWSDGRRQVSPVDRGNLMLSGEVTPDMFSDPRSTGETDTPAHADAEGGQRTWEPSGGRANA